MHARPLASLLLAAALLPAAAAAEPAGPAEPVEPAPVDAAAAETTDAGPVALAYLRAGGLFPGAFNELQASYDLSFGGGWVIPALDHRLAIVLDGRYTAPTQEGTIDDPRLAAGAYSFELTQEDLTFFLGGHWHFADLRTAQWIPYAGLGARLHLLRTTIDGEAGGEPLGESVETSTELGGAARGGIGLRLGPGFLDLQVEGSFAPIAQTITGDANVSALSASLGYTLVL